MKNKRNNKLILLMTCISFLIIYLVSINNLMIQDNYIYNKINLKQKHGFYNKGNGLIAKGTKFDMKYEFLNKFSPLSSKIAFYFKNKEFEEFNQLNIIFKEVKDGQVRDYKVVMKDYNCSKVFRPNHEKKMNRYVEFDLFTLISDKDRSVTTESDKEENSYENLVDYISQKKFSPNEMIFEFFFGNKKYKYELIAGNEQMLNYTLENISINTLDIFNDFKNNNVQYIKLYNNCKNAYYFDVYKWRQLVDDYYDNLILSINVNEIIQQRKKHSLLIFDSYCENEERTYEDSKFVYEKLYSLYKNKKNLDKDTKEKISYLIYYINLDLNIFTESEINTILHLDWDNDINNFDELIFGFELGN